MSTRALLMRLGYVVPAGLAGCFVAVMFIHPAVVTYGFVATVGVVLVLSAGRWERPFGSWLGFARRPRPGEWALLEPAVQLATKVGLGPGRVLVRRVDIPGPGVNPIGRHSVIVDPAIVEDLYRGRLSAAAVGTLVAHAVARQRHGPRYDLAARMWAAPWAVFMVVVECVKAVFSWWPAASLSWSLRGVVGGVVLYQGLQPDGTNIQLATAALIALSYLAPACNNGWQRAVAREADALVARSGLASPLIAWVQYWQADSLERVHRIKVAASLPAPARGGSPLPRTELARSGVHR